MTISNCLSMAIQRHSYLKLSPSRAPAFHQSSLPPFSVPSRASLKPSLSIGSFKQYACKTLSLTTIVSSPAPVPTVPPKYPPKSFFVACVVLFLVLQWVKTHKGWKGILKKNESTVEVLKSIESDLRLVLFLVSMGGLAVKTLKLDQKVTGLGFFEGVATYWLSLFNPNAKESDIAEILRMLGGDGGKK